MPLPSEREKMPAGESYNIFDSDLVAQRRWTRELLRAFNTTEAEADRLAILRQLLGRVGADSLIEPPFYCSYGQNTHLGDQLFAHNLCTIIYNNEVRIGDHVMCGPVVQIYTAAHLLETEARTRGWEVARPVVVEDNV